MNYFDAADGTIRESAISTVGWVMIVLGSIVTATVISVTATLLYVRKLHEKSHTLTKKRVCKQLMSKYGSFIMSVFHFVLSFNLETN